MRPPSQPCLCPVTVPIPTTRDTVGSEVDVTVMSSFFPPLHMSTVVVTAPSHVCVSRRQSSPFRSRWVRVCKFRYTPHQYRDTLRRHSCPTTVRRHSCPSTVTHAPCTETSGETTSRDDHSTQTVVSSILRPGVPLTPT